MASVSTEPAATSRLPLFCGRVESGEPAFVHSPALARSGMVAPAGLEAYPKIALLKVEQRERPPRGAWTTGTGFGRVACRIEYPKGE